MMNRENLKISSVLFNEEQHTYTIDDRELSGVTSLLKRKIFQDLYSNVPEVVLNRKRTQGSDFHREMEDYINFGIEGQTDAFGAFLGGDFNIDFIASEYLVSDNWHYASKIDAIDADGNLYDFKTTYELNVEYCRWQLSIYRYLFYLQNDFIPEKLFVIWMHSGKAEKVEVNGISFDVIKELFNADIDGTEFDDPYAFHITDDENAILEKIAESQAKIESYKSYIKDEEAHQSSLLDVIKQRIKEYNVKKCENEHVRVSIKDAYTRSSVDTKKLKESYPDAYNTCLKEVEVASSVTVKLL